MKNDLISRQAVTKFLNDWLSCLFENCHKQSASDLKMIIKDFKNLPSIQPDTTTHDSIPAETGKNDEDRTTDDLISRQQAIMAIEQHRIAVLEGHKWDEGIEYGYAAAHRHLVDIIEQLPSAQPEIIYCKDCKWCVEHYDTDGNVPYWICKNWDAGTDADGFCHEAERRE